MNLTHKVQPVQSNFQTNDFIIRFFLVHQTQSTTSVVQLQQEWILWSGFRESNTYSTTSLSPSRMTLMILFILVNQTHKPQAVQSNFWTNDSYNLFILSESNTKHNQCGPTSTRMTHMIRSLILKQTNTAQPVRLPQEWLLWFGSF